jgi:putative addiction module component (TIGR02574 family)
MKMTMELLKEVLSLPVEQRALLADTILKSLNAPEADLDRIWIEEAKRRLEELRSGRVKAVPGDEVFQRVRARFGK